MTDPDEPTPDNQPESTPPQSRRDYMRRYQKQLRAKRKRLELSLHLDEHARLKREADRHHMKLATYTREAALAYLDQDYLVPDPDQVQALELAMRQIADDVNQIARCNHEAPDHADIDALRALLYDLEDRITQALRHPAKK